MIKEPFAEGSSVMHRIDPRLRLVAATVFSLIVALSYRPIPLACALVSATMMLFCARLNFFNVFKRFSVLIGFLLLIWLVLPVTYNGAVLMTIGPLDIVKQGVILAMQITIKSIAILAAFIALVATMPIATLGHSLGKLGLPDKIIYLLLMTYRYIFVIEQEYQRLITAIKIRGFSPGTNLHTYRTYAYLVGMLFVRASVRARRVNQAMRCRGFNGKFYCLFQTVPTPYNSLFTLFFIGLSLVLVMFEWGPLVLPLDQLPTFSHLF